MEENTQDLRRLMQNTHFEYNFEIFVGYNTQPKKRAKSKSEVLRIFDRIQM